jgi:translation initiation factor 1 (eIF-1/SUI1)
LELFDISLKEAAKMFGKKFACGSSEVKGEGDLPNVVNIQGDVCYEVAEIIE